MKGQTLLVLMDLPILYRRAAMFYTQAERAFGRFLGPDHEFVLPGHYLRYPAPFSVNLLKVIIGAEDARRASRGLPPLACFDRLAATITTVADFVEKVPECDVAFLQIMPDGRYELKSFATDAERHNVSAYGVFLGTHTGQGGPCPPTGKSVRTDYVYVMEFDGDRIRHMTKIWHSGLAMKELGWV